MSSAPVPGNRPGARGAAALPTAAVDWLLGEQPARVLDLGSGRGAFAATLVDAGQAPGQDGVCCGTASDGGTASCC